MEYKFSIDEARQEWYEIVRVIENLPEFEQFVNDNCSGYGYTLRDKVKKVARDARIGYCEADTDAEEGIVGSVSYVDEFIGSLCAAAGCCKLVIGTRNSKYVFKLPFFEDDIGFDYCANEVSVYEEAAKRGCAEPLAWCAMIGEVCTSEASIPVYVQEACECDECLIEDAIWDAHFSDEIVEDNIEEWMETYNTDNRDEALKAVKSDFEWDDDDNYRLPLSKDHLIDVVDDLYDLFADFCIGDLHTGNWGFTLSRNGDRVLVATDYSGYGCDARDSYDARTGSKRWINKREEVSIDSRQYTIDFDAVE